MKFSVAVAGLALASAQPVYQPTIYTSYVQPHPDHMDVWYPDPDVEMKWLLTPYGCKEGNQDEWVCGFNKVLATLPGTENPSIQHYLTMFSDKYVENNGRFYAVKNSRGSGALTVDRLKDTMKDGLYEVLVPGPNYSTECSSLPGTMTSCVVFNLLMAADNIGQIIAAPARLDPIQVIGVDQVTNRIWGFYPMGSSGDWTYKPTAWGDAKDGSMRSYDWEVIGLSTNDRTFYLWGDFNVFNYHKFDDIECAAPPSAIDDWSIYSGIYCPAADDNLLWKNTWHGAWEQENVIWARASTITRFKSGIWGISIDGKLFHLWNDNGTIRSGPFTHLPNIRGVRAIGGLEDKYVWDSGVLLTNEDDKVYNVYWSHDHSSWKEKEITIDARAPPTVGNDLVLFGSHNGEMYMLYGWYDIDPHGHRIVLNPDSTCGWPYCSLHEVYLYHMKFVGGDDRYHAERIEKDDYFCDCYV